MAWNPLKNNFPVRINYIKQTNCNFYLLLLIFHCRLFLKILKSSGLFMVISLIWRLYDKALVVVPWLHRILNSNNINLNFLNKKTIDWFTSLTWK